MSGNINKRLKDEHWRLYYTLVNAYGEELEYYFKGALVELYNATKRQFTFLYTDCDYIGNVITFNNTIKVGTAKSNANELCQKIWACLGECHCDSQNEAAFKAIYYACKEHGKEKFPSTIKAGNLTLTYEPYEYEGKVYPCYTYYCEMTMLWEWVIPVFINEECVGAFLTGQFYDEKNPPKAKQIFEKVQTLSKDSKDKKDFSELTKEVIGKLIKNLKLFPPNGTETVALFEVVSKTQKSIKNSYIKTNGDKEQKLLQRITELAWGRKDPDCPNDYPLYDDIPAPKPEANLTLPDVIERLKAARTYLFDCAILIREIFGLDQLHLYKPISDFAAMENEITIQGGNLCKDSNLAGIKEKGDEKKYNRTFTHSQHYLKLESCKAKIKESQNDDTEKEFISFCGKNDELNDWFNRRENCELPQNGVDLNLAGYSLIGFVMQGYIDYPIAYLFRLPDDPRTIEKIKEKEHALFRFLERISSIFLSLWVMNYSAYYKRLYKDSNSYFNHEIAQVVAGMNFTNRKFDSLLTAAQNEFANWNYREITIPTNISYLLGSSSNSAETYLKNMDGYDGSIAAILHTSFSRDDKVDKQSFYPYGEFINHLFEIYEGECKKDGKRIIFPIYARSDPRRAPIYSDPEKLERVFNNLLRNAVKYSSPLTNIYVDAKLSDDRSRYEFTVVNYGAPIPEEEEEKIFQNGYRGMNGRLVSVTGIGFGLHMVCETIKKLGEGGIIFGEGNLKKDKEIKERDSKRVICEIAETKILSKYNIPLLVAYADSRFAKRESLEECRELLGTINPNIIREVVSSRKQLIVNPIKEFYYNRHKNEKTARIKFTLWLPYKGGHN